MLSVLKERLDKLSQSEQDWRSFLSLTKPLISTGIKSAVKTVQILSTEDGMLGKLHFVSHYDLLQANSAELFLPFDLEFTYGATDVGGDSARLRVWHKTAWAVIGITRITNKIIVF